MPILSSFERVSREEGLQEGLEKGLEKGRRGALVEVLHGQLEARFGTLPAWVDERLAEADADTLFTWVRRVLQAEQLDDVFA